MVASHAYHILVLLLRILGRYDIMNVVPNLSVHETKGRVRARLVPVLTAY